MRFPFPARSASWARLVADSRHDGARHLARPCNRGGRTGLSRHRTCRARLAPSRSTSSGAIRPRRRHSCSTAQRPQPGTIHRQPELATALRSIAAEGPTAFYSGWIARDMVETLRALGGLHTIDDFASFAPEYVDPISVSYRDYRLWECPPNGQGVAPLMMAKALEGFDSAAWRPDLSSAFTSWRNSAGRFSPTATVLSAIRIWVGRRPRRLLRKRARRKCARGLRFAVGSKTSRPCRCPNIATPRFSRSSTRTATQLR